MVRIDNKKIIKINIGRTFALYEFQIYRKKVEEGDIKARAFVNENLSIIKSDIFRKEDVAWGYVENFNKQIRLALLSWLGFPQKVKVDDNKEFTLLSDMNNIRGVIIFKKQRSEK